MNVLVAGYGLIGAQRVQALTRNRSVTEITVYDPKFSGSGVNLTGKAQTAEAPSVWNRRYDAALIAAPHDVAAEILPAVVKLAPKVLLEKPLGRSLSEAQELAAAARHANTALFIGFNYRYLRNVRRLREFLNARQFGEVLSIEVVLAHGAQPGYEHSWKTHPEKCGGGVCLDPGSHVFDLLLWLFGNIDLVSGYLAQTYWPIAVEDHAGLIFKLPNGALGQVFLSLSSWRSRLEMTIETEKAQFFLRGRGKFYGPQRLGIAQRWPWLNPDEPRETEYNYGSEDLSLEEETDEFVALTRGSPGGCLATAEDGLRVMRLVDSCYARLPRSDRATSSTL